MHSLQVSKLSRVVSHRGLLPLLLQVVNRSLCAVLKDWGYSRCGLLHDHSVSRSVPCGG